MYFDSHNKAECSGCTACMNACPVAALKMEPDVEGFLYPVIDESICINCGLCRKVCSWEHPQFNNDENPAVLASVLKNKAERQRSTSGGAFYAIAEWIVLQKGVVYGAAFDENLQLHHISAETIEELQPIRGSKYLQSKLEGVFKDVEKNLKLGRWCYFTGTGCQVAGLKAYLRKDYTTLITSDLVCHGVPSQKIFNEHISYMEKKYNDKITSYRFRDYKLGEGCETCCFANRKSIIKPSYMLSPYLYSFMYAYTYRYSCYECRFAHVPRQGDFTLADFWGIQKYFPDFDISNGVSLLLINTQRGTKLWNKIKGEFTFVESNITDAARNNSNLVHPSDKPEIREIVYQEIEKRGYADVAKKEFRCKNYVKISIINYILRNPLALPFLVVYRKVKYKIFR